MITTINEFRKIFEIGEASIAPYEFTAHRVPEYPTTLQGFFTTEKGIKYTVTGWIKEELFDNVDLRIVFHTDIDENEPEAETNHNNQYKVMSTVIAIVKKFLEIAPEVNQISFTAKQKENRIGSNQRLMMYRNYVEKNFPGWKLIPGYLQSKITLQKQLQIAENFNAGVSAVKPFIYQIINKAFKLHPEYEMQDQEFSCTGSCEEISNVIYSELKNSFKCELLHVTKNADNFDAEHTAVYLPDYDLIIDTQVWQFTNHRTKNCNYVNVEPISQRKIFYTSDEYFNQLGFKIQE